MPFIVEEETAESIFLLSGKLASGRTKDMYEESWSILTRIFAHALKLIWLLSIISCGDQLKAVSSGLQPNDSISLVFLKPKSPMKKISRLSSRSYAPSPLLAILGRASRSWPRRWRWPFMVSKYVTSHLHKNLVDILGFFQQISPSPLLQFFVLRKEQIRRRPGSLIRFCPPWLYASFLAQKQLAITRTLLENSIQI